MICSWHSGVPGPREEALRRPPRACPLGSARRLGDLGACHSLQPGPEFYSIQGVPESPCPTRHSCSRQSRCSIPGSPVCWEQAGALPILGTAAATDVRGVDLGLRVLLRAGSRQEPRTPRHSCSCSNPDGRPGPLCALESPEGPLCHCRLGSACSYCLVSLHSLHLIQPRSRWS